MFAGGDCPCRKFERIDKKIPETNNYSKIAGTRLICRINHFFIVVALTKWNLN